MIDPQIQAYLEQCRAAGLSTEQIRTALLQAGWLPEQVAEILPEEAPPSEVISPEAVTPETVSLPELVVPQLVMPEVAPVAQKRPRFVRVAVWGILGLLIVFSGSIVLAEKGYFPAFSKIYRKTKLPILWGATTADPVRSLGKMYLSTQNVQNTKEVSRFDVSVSVNDPNKQANLKQSKIFAAVPFDDTRADSLSIGDTLASPSPSSSMPSSTINPMSSVTNMFLPLNFGATTTMITDKENLDVKTELDLGSLYSKFGSFIKPYLPDLALKNTFEAKVLMSQKNAYLRSSIIPYLQSTDKNKWLKFVLPADLQNSLDELKKEATSQQAPSDQASIQKDLQTVSDVLNSTIKDDGIIRRNDRAVAEYVIDLNKDTIKEISAKANIPADYKSLLSSFANQNINMKMTVWLDPQSAQLVSMEMKINSVDDPSNTKLQVSMSCDFSYDQNLTVVAPATSETISQPGDKYLEDIVNKMFPGMISGYDKLNTPVIDTPGFPPTL